MLDLDKVRGVIFDLDGTLYADRDHFSFYTDLLAARLGEEVRESFLQDVSLAWQGRHCLRMGRVYDRQADLVLETTPAGQVLNAWTWAGEPISATKISELYQEPVTFDMTSMISVGDGWWIPTSCAYHYRIESTYDAYVRTKDYLSSDKARLSPIPGVKEALQVWSEKYTLVVATNSDLLDTERILSRLGLQELFAQIYAECRKPKYTKEVFARIVKDHAIPAENWLSVGDNYLNDIYPAQQMGMQGCLIDPNSDYHPEDANLVVTDLSNLLITS